MHINGCSLKTEFSQTFDHPLDFLFMLYDVLILYTVPPGSYHSHALMQGWWISSLWAGRQIMNRKNQLKHVNKISEQHLLLK